MLRNISPFYPLPRYSARNCTTRLIGVFLFGASSISCGFAQTFNLIIVSRAIQGIGGALLVPGSLALIGASFPETMRGRAIGIWSGTTAISAMIGPLLGGWLVQNASWRWISFLKCSARRQEVRPSGARFRSKRKYTGLTRSAARHAPIKSGLVARGLRDSGTLFTEITITTRKKMAACPAELPPPTMNTSLPNDTLSSALGATRRPRR